MMKKFENFRESDPDKERERIARFDIRKAFISQIVNNPDTEIGNITGAWFDTQRVIQRAYVLCDHNGHLGVIEYDFVEGELIPKKDTLVQTPEEIQGNIDKFAH